MNLRNIRKFIEKRDLQYFLLFLLVFAVFTKSYVGSWNDASRMATIESLVERGTFAIDNSTYNWTGDKVYIKEHFYSDKPPVLSFLAAGPYFLMKNLGLSFQNNERFVYYMLTFLLVGIPASITVYIFNKSLKLIRLPKNTRSKLVIGLGAGTLLLPFSTVFNSHIPAMALCFVGFYLLLKNKFHTDKKNIFLAGFFVSLAATIDIIAGSIFFIFFLAYILWSRLGRSCVIVYLTAALVPFLLHSILNIQITGSILPVQFMPEYFEYPESKWSKEYLSGFATHPNLTSLLTYAFHSLFGFHGLFSYTPVLLIFFFGLPKAKLYNLQKEAVMIFLAIISLLLFYIFRTNNYGGFSYGIRWFIPLIPFFMFFGSLFLKKKRNFQIFYVLFAISFIISLIGIINPWSDMTIGPIPILNNLKQLR
jgi:hypothetical protein